MLELFCRISKLKLLSPKSSSNYPGLGNALVHISHTLRKECVLQRSEGNILSKNTAILADAAKDQQE